jgi:serine/threonine protein kinase
MLHGYPPFDGQTKQSILEKILKNDYRFNVLKMFSIDEEIRANSSRAVIDLIERMLTDNPKTRITIFEIGNHPWILKNLSQMYLLYLFLDCKRSSNYSLKKR